MGFEENLSDKDIQSAKEEIADIFIYLLRLSDKLGINVEDAVNEKLEINANKYPVDLAKNNAVKYNNKRYFGNSHFLFGRVFTHVQIYNPCCNFEYSCDAQK